MRINKNISQIPYHRSKRFTKGRWITFATKKHCKSITYSHHSKHSQYMRYAERLRENGYRVKFSITDPAWHL